MSIQTTCEACPDKSGIVKIEWLCKQTRFLSTKTWESFQKEGSESHGYSEANFMYTDQEAAWSL